MLREAATVRHKFACTKKHLWPMRGRLADMIFALLKEMSNSEVWAFFFCNYTDAEEKVDVNKGN